MLASWKIPLDKVHLVLRENAANMVKAMRDSALPSFGCFAHSLQLVVNDGVLAQQAVLDLLASCRKIVGHFKHSTTAYSKLQVIQERLQLPLHRLQQDVKTRWNSSLYMLKSVLEQKMALAAYASEHELTVLTPYQADLAAKVVAALEPIEETTKAISADSTSIAVVIPMVRMLTKTLEKHHDDVGIRTMKKEMLKRRFADIEINEYTALATILDPRFKNKFFTGTSERVNVKMLLKEKLEALECTIDDTTSDLSKENSISLEERESPPSKRQKTEMWKAFTEILEESGESTEIDEVERYLTEPIIDFHKNNCYTWWDDNSKRFPLLSKLALKYLSSPCTSVPSERLFSGASLIYDEKRNRLAPERAETLLLIKNNFNHYLNFTNQKTVNES